MASVKITYTAISAPAAQPVAQICATYVPENAAADLPVFAGTYYDTNVDDTNIVARLQKFFQDSIAHPGLIAAFKEAVKSGTYTMEVADDKELLYVKNVGEALADQGFTVEEVTPEP